MRKTILLLAIALMSPPPSAYSQAGKDNKSDKLIKLTTELVPLDVQVIDRKAQHAIGGLAQRDFEIFDDGVKQEIAQFSQDKLPLSVVLLLDASSSMWPVLERLRANAVQALQSLKHEDEVAVVVTANETLLVRDFTKDKLLVGEVLRELDFKAFGTNGILLHDSVYRAASHLLKAANPADRRVIIVVTDNETIPAYNWRVFQKEQAVSLVLETGAVVCGLVIKRNLPTRAASKLLSFPYRLGGGDVYDYAEITGGEVLAAGNDTVGEKLIELIEHLRSRYSLAFVPSNTKRDGKFRRLKVRLTAEREQQLRNAGSKQLVVRTRSGYYAAKK